MQHQDIAAAAAALITDRKIEVVRAPPGYGRDAGKWFKITEWDAFRAEWWAWRMALAVKGTTAQLPLETERLGVVGVAIRGLNAFMAADVDPIKLKPLLDEMMECVQIVRDPLVKDPTNPRYPQGDAMHGQGDVAEVYTIGWLRSEVLRVHTGFSFADALWALASQIRESSTPTTPTSQP